MDRREVLGRIVFGASVVSARGARADAAGGRAVPSVPFELNANKVYLPVWVNGAGPFSFILDTGAPFNAVDRARAQALGLRLSGSGVEHGAGEGTIERSEAAGVALEVAGCPLARANLPCLPVDAAVSRGEGRHVDGLLGGPFFEQFVVEIDYDRSRLRLHRPEGFAPPAGAASIPLAVEDGHCFVDATVVLAGGRRVAGHFLVDTGLRSALTVARPFGAAHEVAAGLSGAMAATVGVGLGGESRSIVGRAERLELGTVTVQRPVINVSTDRAGAFASEDLHGIIGGELLRRYRAIFDYPRGRLYLQPASGVREPYEFDMSGLFVTAHGPDLKRFEVLRVEPGSPASEAGIAPGDVLTALDDRPASELTLEKIRRALFKRPGQEYSLSLQRGAEDRKTRLRLRRLI